MTYDTKFAVGDLVLMLEGWGKNAYFYPSLYEIARIEIEQGRKGKAIVKCRLRRPGSYEEPNNCMWTYASNVTPATEESIKKACEDHAAALLKKLAKKRR